MASSESAVLEGPDTTGYCPSTACVFDTAEDHAALAGHRPWQLLGVEPATPHGDLAFEGAACASTAAGVLVPEGDNGNHNG